MSYIYRTIDGKQIGHLDYEIGDQIMSDDGSRSIGTCTGFTPDNTCILIDGKCWGGKYYFHKYDIEDIEYQEV